MLNLTATKTKEIELNNKIQLSLSETEQSEGISISNVDWQTDFGKISETSNSGANFTFTKNGTANILVKVTYSDSSIKQVSIQLTSVLNTDNLKYIHELSSRNSAFLWVGYWVLYEIEYAVKNNIDWINDQSKLKYKDELKTISYMLSKYDNIEIQESRNGKIINKEKIESGLIYSISTEDQEIPEVSENQNV